MSYQFSFTNEEEEESYLEKPVQIWNWLDFQHYFDDEYTRVIRRSAPILAKNEYKKRSAIVSSSIKLRGNDLFKAMIDWLFANYQRYPQWDLVTISLICGKHYYANMIADQAQKSIKHQIRWEDE